MRSAKERKWFLWHLVNNLDGYQFFVIKIEHETVGAICINADFYADIIILENYRGLNIGSLSVSQLKQMVPEAKFQVNTFNRKVIKFFEGLLLANILSMRTSRGFFFIYQ